MHHPISVRPVALWSSVLCLVLGSAALAQPPMPPTAPAPGRAVGGLIVPIGVAQKVQMRSGRRISNVNNPKQNIARVQAVVDDPLSVLITGQEAGVTTITLTDEAGNKETIEVLVQTDVEYLSSVLKRISPTSTLFPIPAANGTIVLTGNVGHAEDVDGIMKTAYAVIGGPDRVINMMRVGGVMQVQLDVVVAQVNRTEARSFGFNLLASGPSAIFGSTVGGVSGALPTVGTTPPSAFNSGGQGGSSQQTTGILTGGAISGSPGSSNLFLGVVANGTSYLGFLQALRNEQLAKILARPSVVTLSGRPASFLSGGEQAVPVPAGLGQVGVQFEEFGTRLNVLPIVLGNGKIHLEVEPEVSALNAAFGTTISGATVPGRDTQRVHTTVEMEDGQTFVIGGLIQRSINSATNKVPVLGDLPFVGAAFSSKVFTEEEQELVVLVTPHLVDAMSCDQAPKILPGQETRSPDDFELFLEGILEAPRGPRVVCPNYRYVPAYKNGPTSTLFPCAGEGNGAAAGCGAAGCATGTPGCSQPACGTAVLTQTADQAPAGIGKLPALPLTTTAQGDADRQQ